MATDARISTALPSHPKTKKLVRQLGGQAGWSLVCLILWAAANRSDGDLTGMSDEDIELASDWDGEEGQFVAALRRIRFIDGAEGESRVHDWTEHQPWASGAEARSFKGKWNAIKKHHGEAEADRQVPEYAAIRHANAKPPMPPAPTQDASSNGAAAPQDAPSPAPIPTPSPSPSPTPPSEAPAPRASRQAPRGMAVTVEVRDWVAEKGLRVDVDAEFEKFRDHTFKTAITDWPGALRNWLRRAAEGGQYGPQARASPQRQPTAAEQRAMQAVPSIAAPHLRQQPKATQFVEEVPYESPLALG